MIRYLWCLLLFLLMFPAAASGFGVENVGVVGGPAGGGEETPIFHWDASGTGQGTLIEKAEPTTITETGTVDYTKDGSSGKGAEFIVDSSKVQFTGGTNFPYESGRVEFWFKDTLAGDLSYATMFQAGTGLVKVVRYGVNAEWLRVQACSSGNWNVDTGVTIWDGNGHDIVFSWDDASDTLKLQVDGGTVFTKTDVALSCINHTSMYVGAEFDGSPICGGIMDEVKIYDTPL